MKKIKRTKISVSGEKLIITMFKNQNQKKEIVQKTMHTYKFDHLCEIDQFL